MKKYILVGLVVIAVISLSGCSPKSETTSASPAPVVASPTTETETTTDVAVIDTYKDGSYDATGAYVSPGGAEEVEVKVTLKDNVITDADVVAKATRPESKKYQEQFIEGYKAMVVGKNINEVSLTKVSGSSLTPKGFNDAITKIKAEAKV